ncbi:TraB/GumN family protein [Endozoicomonas elysicola]|nr:hypothetical protein [Endozoicomonas elysicola]
MNIIYALRAFLILFVLMGVLQAHASVSDTVNVIGDDRIQLLKYSGTDDYHVRVLYGEVDGIFRAVVLFGQNFVKSEMAASRESELLSLSSLRGFEGFVFKTPLAASTIEPLNRFRLFLQHQIVTLISSISRGYSVDDCSVIGKGYFIQCYEKDGSVTVTPDNPQMADKVNVMLEAGGSDMVTAANVSYLPAMILIGLSGASSTTFSTYLNSLPSSPLIYLGWTVYVVSNYLEFQSIYLSYKGATYGLFGELTSGVSPYIFPVFHWMMDYRDELMARNIVETFSLRPDDSDMVVIIGRAHAAGIVRFLNKKHSFVDVTDQVLYERKRGGFNNNFGEIKGLNEDSEVDLIQPVTELIPVVGTQVIE